MSKSTTKTRVECFQAWLEWFKKQPDYRKHNKPKKLAQPYSA